MIIEKYNRRADSVNSLLCVGLDSDIERVPEAFREKEFPQFEFNKFLIERTHRYAAAFKANIAFYEARGDRGLRELKMTTDYLRQGHPDIFLICDAKRGDVDNTNRGYVEEIFDWLGFDAVTLHPYLGKAALQPFLDRKDKGCIVVCRTSNTGAGELQDLLVEGKPLWRVVAEKVRDEWNENGNCMLVVGATYPKEMGVIRAIAGDMTFLVPGMGAQGGDVAAAVTAGQNSEKKGLIVHAARSVIFSDDPETAARKHKEEINHCR